MIKININIKSNFIKQIELKGHAGSGNSGYDLVCCSVSTLIIALINGLREYLKADIDFDIKEGYSLLKINETNPEKKEKIDVLTKTFLLSVESLEEENPEFIKVNIMEE